MFILHFFKNSWNIVDDEIINAINFFLFLREAPG